MPGGSSVNGAGVCAETRGTVRDEYSFCDDKCAVTLATEVGTRSCAVSVAVIDFLHLKYVIKSARSRTGAKISNGAVSLACGPAAVEVLTKADGSRRIVCTYKGFLRKSDLTLELETDPNAGRKVNFSPPARKKNRSCHVEHTLCLRGNGRFSVGEDRHEFKHVYGVCDRRVGDPLETETTYRLALSCESDGKALGLDIGTGADAEKSGSVLYGETVCNTNEVKFDIPYTQGVIDYLKPWRITDDAEKLELIFYPMVEGKEQKRGLRKITEYRNVFGKIYGKTILDDGTIVTIANKIGHAQVIARR